MNLKKAVDKSLEMHNDPKSVNCPYCGRKINRLVERRETNVYHDSWGDTVVGFHCPLCDNELTDDALIAGDILNDRIKTAKRYSVFRTINGCSDDPDDNEFDNIEDALDMYNDMIERALFEIKEAKRWSVAMDIEIAIRDTFDGPVKYNYLGQSRPASKSDGE